MIRRPPKSTRTDTLFPYTTRFRSMLLHVDLFLAASGTTFSMPFVNLGLVPEAASSLLLPRLIGRQRAAKHLLLGDSFDAETALEYGLVTGIVPAEELGRQLCALSERLAAKPPEAVRLTKALLIDRKSTRLNSSH